MNRLEKSRAAKAELAAKYATQVIPIDKKWRIVRFDTLNWQVQQFVDGSWCHDGYYGKLGPALKAVSGKMLSDEVSGSLANVLERVEAIKTRVDEALRTIKEKVESGDIDPADLIDATEHQFGRRGEP